MSYKKLRFRLVCCAMFGAFTISSTGCDRFSPAVTDTASAYIEPSGSEEETEERTAPPETSSDSGEESIEITLYPNKESGKTTEDPSTILVTMDHGTTEEEETTSEEDTSEETTGEETSAEETTSEDTVNVTLPTTPVPTTEVPPTEPPYVEAKYPGLPDSVNRPFIALTRSILANAYKYNGNANTFRLAQAIKKAQNGQPVTIGVLGGSITQGTGASSAQSSYAAILEAYWRTTFPQSDLTFINAGIGATTSYLGLHRVSGLLSASPDLVIVEFSVNDEGIPTYQNYYNNLVYRILTAPSEPAVMLLFMTSKNYIDSSSLQVPIGRQYGVPMISFREAVLPLLRGKAIKWSDISPDTIHPNDNGHSLAARLLIQYIETVRADIQAGNVSRSYSVPKTGATAYYNAEIYDSRNLTPVSSVGFTATNTGLAPFSFGWVSEYDPNASIEIPETTEAETTEEETTLEETTQEETLPAETTPAVSTEADTTAAETTTAPTTPAETKPTSPTKDAPKSTTAVPTTAAPTKAAPTTATPTTVAPTKVSSIKSPLLSILGAGAKEPTTQSVPVMPEITFTVTAKNIGILYMSTRDGSIDDMQVYIDGVLVTTLSGTVEGPDHHISTEVYTSKTAATHTVTLRRSPNSRGHHFELEGLLLS